LLSTREVREMLSVHDRTVRKWVSCGFFPQPMRLGRVLRWKRSVVEQWIEKQAKQAGR
jgi:excisionase family DNA binding protein